MKNESAQNKAVERLLADGWVVYPNWDLRPWEGPIVMQKENKLLAISPEGRSEVIDVSELPAEDARWYKKLDARERLLRPLYLFRLWLTAFGCGLFNEKNQIRFGLTGSKKKIATGRWVCFGPPELDDARWVRLGPIWFSWPIWWLPGSLEAARRRYHR